LSLHHAKRCFNTKTRSKCHVLSHFFSFLSPHASLARSLPHAPSSSSLALPAPRTYTRSHRVTPETERAKTLARSFQKLPPARGGDAGREPHAPRGARPPRFLPRPRQARKRPPPFHFPPLLYRSRTPCIRGACGWIRTSSSGCFWFPRSDLVRREAGIAVIHFLRMPSIRVSDATDRAGLGNSGLSVA
jgi:hypothetical protein